MRAALLRTGLYGLSIPYGMAMMLRNILYDNRLLRISEPDVPLISVGNLTLGGTGKTPFVAWLSQFLHTQGRHVGLVSRGYGRVGEHNDEFRELALRLPDVPHEQSPHRLSACRRLLARNDLDCIILDDAFQHRRIDRRLDIVLVDALEPFGFDYLFPRGMLREPTFGLRRADIVLLSRADLIEPAERIWLREKIATIAPNAIYGEIAHRPESLAAFPAPILHQPLEILKGQRILAFCGIGNPLAFARTLEELGVILADLIPFPDHHRFTLLDYHQILEKAKSTKAEMLVATMKDLVKIKLPALEKLPLRALTVGITFLEGESAVRHRILDAV